MTYKTFQTPAIGATRQTGIIHPPEKLREKVAKESGLIYEPFSRPETQAKKSGWPGANVFETIAGQNAALYHREKSQRHAAETLIQMGHILSETLDVDTLLSLILDYLTEIAPYDRAAILLEKDDQLEVVATRGYPSQVEAGQLSVSLAKNTVFQQVYHTQRPLSIPDIWQYPIAEEVINLPAGRSWLGLPLVCFDRVIGVISLTRRVRRAYGQDQISLTGALARQAAIALRNAQVHDKIAQFSQKLETMVYERTQALQTTYAQLEYLDETKADFISIAAHELRTPLTSLKGYSQILLNDETIQKNSYLSTMLSTVHSSANRLHDIINSMLDVAKIDSQTLELVMEPVSLLSLIQQVHKTFEAALTEREQTLNLVGFETLPVIEADPEVLHKAFHNLISNAIKYTPNGGVITISARPLSEAQQQQPGVEIVVCDTGIGIDPEDQELIFTKFYRADDLTRHSTGQTKFKGAGPGLGLPIAYGIIAMHQGRLWVESPGYDEETCPGSKFYVRLPLKQGAQ